MIGTRVLVGSLLALAALSVLVVDRYIDPWFPCLFCCLMIVGTLASRELLRLFPEPLRPSRSLVVTGTLLCLATPWYPAVRYELGLERGSAWPLLVFVYVSILGAAFLLEMYRYRGASGVAVPRLGATMLAVSYLGVLPCFFTQIRLIRSDYAGLFLAATILVPKVSDVAAFFTGTFLGRTKMTPLLSPKKTWEGFAGGVIGGMAVAIVVELSAPVFRGGLLEAAAFGLVLAIAGVLGDLAESLIKRDCQTKDASSSIPGFGGVLDVIDSVLFAAPVAYLWFSWNWK